MVYEKYEQVADEVAAEIDEERVARILGREDLQGMSERELMEAAVRFCERVNEQRERGELNSPEA